MKLVIAEKPSVAASIAAAVGADKKENGYIEGNGYIVSWCFGHLVELCEPEDYNEAYKKWSYETLPIIPDDWKFKVKKDTKKQYDILKKLLHDGRVTSVVNACDAGREGENIFRHVYNMAGCTKPMERLWISSMEESAVRDGMANVKPGREYDSLYLAALAREKADWLVGINLTRNFTVLYNARNVLKIGRVLTPTLAMIAERELEIQNFKKEKYHVVHLVSDGIEAVSEHFSDREEAVNLMVMCTGKAAKVTSYVMEKKKSQPPKLYDLTSLQMDASRLFGFTAKQTLDLTQALYEKKLVTYPRSDSRFVTHNEESVITDMVALIKNKMDFAAGCTDKAAPNVKAVINDKKVTDHHAIIPTKQIAKPFTVTESEKKILYLVEARLLAATAAPMEYSSAKVILSCGGRDFTAGGKHVISEGYKVYENNLRDYFKAKPDTADTDGVDGESDFSQNIPELTEGMEIRVSNCGLSEYFTKPPKRYSESSLLSAMEHAGNKEMDADVERKGLGTTATRADIIEKMIKQGYVRREKKLFVPTDDGMNLINVLPEQIKSVSMTVDMENMLAQVAKGEVTDTEYLQGITDFVTEIISRYSAISEDKKDLFSSQNKIGTCPVCHGDVVRGKFGVYCTKKCGMKFGRIGGKEATEKQWADVLSGKRILMKGLKSKKGTTYDAYFTPTDIEEFSYKDKQGKKHEGLQYVFEISFPKRK